MAPLSDEAGCANILKLLGEGEETVGILRELSSDSSYRTMREKEEKYDKILLAREEYLERKATIKHKNLVMKAIRESGFAVHYREEFSHLPSIPVRDSYLSPLLVALGAPLHSADIQSDAENIRRLNMLKGKLSARNLGVIVLDSPTKVTKVWVCENFEMLKKYKELMDGLKGSVPTVF